MVQRPSAGVHRAAVTAPWVVFWVWWWFRGCFGGGLDRSGGFLAVELVCWLFLWFSGCLGGFLPLWCNCLAISVIAWPLRPFSARFGYFWVILAPHWPFLVSSASFWPFVSVSAGFWPLHSPKRHKIVVYRLTIHLPWEPGHTQASRRIFIFIRFGAACLLFCCWCCYNLEANLESHYK